MRRGIFALIKFMNFYDPHSLKWFNKLENLFLAYIPMAEELMMFYMSINLAFIKCQERKHFEKNICKFFMIFADNVR